VLKPSNEGQKIGKSNVYKAEVVKIDQSRDLALLKMTGKFPKLRPLKFGTVEEIQVGMDVHAIGHPKGQSWTYTKGFVSQFRKNYKWNTELGYTHSSDVIQSQTPISPGNSGGPLLNDAGEIIGVNSFKARGEALNFSVAINEVSNFLKAKSNFVKAKKTPKQKCKMKVTFEGRNKRNTGNLKLFDLNCDQKPEVRLFVPDIKSEPITMSFDKNRDQKTDILVLDKNRDGKWDESYHDVDFDGKTDLRGYHPDGKLKPSRYVKYKKT
jgi:hypothetical protein